MKAIFLAIVISLLAVSTFSTAFAQDAPVANSPVVSIKLNNPLELDCTDVSQLECLVDKIVNTLIIVAFPIATLMILWGAFLLMTSGGNTEKIEQGWTTIRYTVYGFVVLLLATLIVSVVQGVFTSVTSGGGPGTSDSSVGGPPSGNQPPSPFCGDNNPTGSCPTGETCLYVNGGYGCYGPNDR